MAEAKHKQSTPPLSDALYSLPARNILIASLGASIALQYILHPFNSYTLIAVCLVYLCYSLSSSWWLRQPKAQQEKQQLFAQMNALDAAVFSAVASVQFHNLPVLSLLFVATSFSAVIIGSRRQTLVTCGSFVVSAGAATLLLDLKWSYIPPTEVTPLLIAGLILFLGEYGYHIQGRFQRVRASNSKLYNDLVVHKVRTYKLSRYVSPTVWTALNQDKDKDLKTERKRVSVFFSDIEGFSALSEELEAETLTDLLNTYLTEMVKIAAKHKGTIDKFMGDGLMVIFGDTNSGGMKADCTRCVSMAIDMRRKMKQLETKWFNQGIKKPLKIRMGINSGYCTVGTFGTSEYMDYTVLGTHVNLASRLESAADAGEILISHETWSLIKDVVMCRDRGEIKAKGFAHPIKVYQVIEFRKQMGANQSYFEENLQGFSMHLDLEQIKNYDREKIIKQLEELGDKIRDR